MQARRASQTTCQHSRLSVEIVRFFADGTRHVYRGCAECGHAEEPGRYLKEPSFHDPPVLLDDRLTRPPCIRCGAFGTQLHHFAPRAIFGAEEAELWPSAWLCPDCHDYWHRMMKGAE